MRISDWGSDVCSSDLAVPVGCMGQAAQALAAGLKRDAIVSDVGSSKAGVAAALREALPGHIVIPAHPVAGTENRRPAAGFAHLFEGRWRSEERRVGEKGVSTVRFRWAAGHAKK